MGDSHAVPFRGGGMDTLFGLVKTHRPLRLVVALGLVAAWSNASAWSGLTTEYAANVSIVEAKGLLKGGPYTVTPIAGAGARVSGAVNLVGPGGRVVATELGLGLSRHAALAVAARAVSVALPVAMVGFAVYDMYRAFRVHSDGQGGLGYDPGVPQVTQNCLKIFKNGIAPPTAFACAPTASGAYAAMAAVINGSGCALPWTGSCTSYTGFISGPAAPATAGWVTWSVRTESRYQGGPVTVTTGTTGGDLGKYGTVVQCAEIMVGGALVPSSVGLDGLCETVKDFQPSLQPFTPAQAADKVMTASEFAASADYADMLRESIGLGPITLPTGADAPEQELPATGVPSIPGPVVTTQDETGTTETATGWNFARDPLRKNTGTWPETKTTTKKDPAGNPIPGATTTTTTTTQPGAAPGTTADPSDPCTLDPGRLGCVGLGEVEDVPLGEKEIPVSFLPAVGFGADSGTCPAPMSVQTSFGSIEIDNSMLCTFLGSLRFVIVAAAALVGAGIFLGGLKS